MSFPLVAPLLSGRRMFNFIFTTPVVNFDFFAQCGSPTDPILLNILLMPGASLGSTAGPSGTSSGISLQSFHRGSEVNIDVRAGALVGGLGGRGGKGAYRVQTEAEEIYVPAQAGLRGGDAINLGGADTFGNGLQVMLINAGTLAGAGGGGGGGGPDNSGSDLGFGGGGGGGAGLIPGVGGESGSIPEAYAGSDGTATSGGNGGLGADVNGSPNTNHSGGRGGDLGQFGTSGSLLWGGAFGGANGKAVFGVTNRLTVVNTGTMIGGIGT